MKLKNGKLKWPELILICLGLLGLIIFTIGSKRTFKEYQTSQEEAKVQANESQTPLIRVIQATPEAAELCVKGKTFFSTIINGGSVFALVLGQDRKPIPCDMEE